MNKMYLNGLAKPAHLLMKDEVEIAELKLPANCKEDCKELS